MRLLYCYIILLMSLTGCPDSGSSTSSAPTGLTWPPRTPSELLQAVNGRTYTLVGYSDTLTISSSQLTYNGPASDWHIATVFTDLTHNYQTVKACNYVGSNLQISSDFTLNYTLTNTTDYEPGGIQHCKLNTPSSSITFTNESNCLIYDGAKFCY